MSGLQIHTDRRPSPPTPPFSPTILTPEAPHNEDAPPSIMRGLSFTKHPVPPPAFDSMSQPSTPVDGQDRTTPVGSHKPVSLLSAMLSSPEVKRAARATRAPSISGVASAQSSMPSTTISSPSHQPHGILQTLQAPAEPGQTQQNQPTSILRRGSTSASSDAGVEPSGLGLMLNGLGMLGLDSVNKKLDKLDPHRLERVEEKREKIEWADKQPAPSAQPIGRTPSQRLKFAVAPFAPAMTPSASDSHSRASSRRPSSPFARERAAQVNVDVEEELDDEDEGEEKDEAEEHPSVDDSSRQEIDLGEDDSDASSAGGYDEDEEDGAFESDEDWPLGFEPRARLMTGESSKYPFARSTNYDRKNPDALLSSPNASPPAAPVLQLPPARRGRGHIKVDPAAVSDGQKCSRHCSPPPQRSRSNSRSIDAAPAPSSSPSARRLKRGGSKSTSPARTDDAGPRGGRAGSPMPERLEVSDDEVSDDEYEGSVEALANVRGGWRSDDSVFYGPNAQRVNRTAPTRLAGIARNISAPPTRSVFEESDGGDLAASVHTDAGPERPVAGVRNFLRRASETLQGLARPILPLPTAQSIAEVDAWHQSSAHDGGMLAPLPSKPILDDTPVLARSVSPRGDGLQGGVAHRLEQALLVPASDASDARARSHTTSGGPGSAGLGRTKSLGSNKVTFGPPPRKEALLHRASTTALGPGAGLRSQRADAALLSQPIACQSGRKLEKIRARDLS